MVKMDAYYAGSRSALALVDELEVSNVDARREFNKGVEAWRDADSGMSDAGAWKGAELP